MKKRQVIAFPVSLITSAIILALASQPVLAQANSHTVQAGEYLYSIAQQYGVSVSQLKEWNHLTSDDLQAGVQLLVTSPEVEVELEETNLVNNPDEVEVELEETDLVNDPNQAEVELEETDLVETPDLAETDLVDTPAPVAQNITAEEDVAEPVMMVATAQSEEVSPPENPAPVAASVEEDYSSGNVVIHVVKAGEYLNLIARHYGVSADELRLWNHLTSDTLQIGQELKVIADTVTPTEPEENEDDHSGDVVSYLVKAGDTLWGIATRFGVSTNDLRLWNHLTTDTLQIGQALKLIPDITDPTYPDDPDDHSGDVVTYSVKAGDTLWSIGRRFDVSLNNLRLWNHLTTDFLSIGQELKLIPPVPGPTDPESPPTETSTHIVRSGDTLWAISRRYGVTVNQIKQWNHLTSNFLSVGQRLSIDKANPTPPPVDDTHYVVVSGDTLWGIATRYGVTVANLKDWNRLTSNLLTIGQRLIIAGEATPNPPTTSFYTVRSGDTLWAISRRNGVSVQQLMTWNKLTSSFLAIGQNLTVSQPRVTYTVQAGDSLWKIATQFGSTIEQLKRWNGLTSNVIYVNQVFIVK